MRKLHLSNRSILAIIRRSLPLAIKLVKQFPLIIIGYSILTTFLHIPEVTSTPTRMSDSTWIYLRALLQMIMIVGVSSWLSLALYGHEKSLASQRSIIESLKEHLPALFLATLLFSVIMFLLAKVNLLIFLGIMFVYYIPLILFENNGPIQAIINSARLVWGSWWRTFTLLIICLMLPLGVLGYYLPPIPFVVGIVNCIALVVWSPLCVAIWLEWYHELRARHIILDANTEWAHG